MAEMRCEFRNKIEAAIFRDCLNYWGMSLFVKDRAFGNDTPACVRLYDALKRKSNG